MTFNINIGNISSQYWQADSVISAPISAILWG